MSVPRDPMKASGVGWLLAALALAAVANLIADVPFYFGSVVPLLGSLYRSDAYRRYAPLLNLAVPAFAGVVGVVGILHLERGQGWTLRGRPAQTRLALFLGAAAGASLFATGLILGLRYVPAESWWNSVRMTLRFFLVLAAGMYLLGAAGRLDPGHRTELAKMAFTFGTFAAAVRMGIAIANGFFGASGSSSQLVAALSLSAFVIAILSLLSWIVVYAGIRRRLSGGAASPRSDMPRNGRVGG